MPLYRGMLEAHDGLPAVGPSGRMLGVRPGNGSTPDVLAVHPADPVLPGQGGMSVAPGDPLQLPRHRRPASLGGIGRDPVWYIEIGDLGPDLDFRQDRPGHGLVEPKRPMTLADIERALSTSRALESVLPIGLIGAIAMSNEQRIVTALRSTEPAQALRVLVDDLGREGRSKTDVIHLLEMFLVQHRGRDDHREVDDEVVLDVLDALRGWCHPTAELH